MRAFIALDLPPDVRHALAQLQCDLAASGADVAWVAEPNLHVTMRFLGEISDERRGTVEAMLGAVAAHTVPFQSALSQLGAFPSASSPRVLWVGIEEGREPCSRLAQEIEGELVTRGFQREEREFTAHVTLGRVRSPKNRGQLVDRFKTLGWTPPPPFLTDHLTLFRSVLSARGSTYTALARAPFQAAA